MLKMYPVVLDVRGDEQCLPLGRTLPVGGMNGARRWDEHWLPVGRMPTGGEKSTGRWWDACTEQVRRTHAVGDTHAGPVVARVETTGETSTPRG